MDDAPAPECLSKLDYDDDALHKFLIEMISMSTQNKLSRDMISNNVVCATSKPEDQPAHMRSLIRAFASRLNTL